MSPGHDHPHGHETHHTTSSGHKWTCLFWLVHSIISPLTPHLQLQIHCASALVQTNQSDWLLLSMSSPTRVRSCLIHPAWEQQSHLRGSVGVPGRDTFTFERAERAASVQAKRRTTADPVTRRIKGSRDADVKPGGAACFFWSLYLHGSWQLELKNNSAPNGRFISPLSQPLSIKLISMLNYSLCQMKDATINVYDWLSIEVWVIVSWSIEPDVCVRAVTTKHRLAILMHFNYHLIVWLCPDWHF